MISKRREYFSQIQFGIISYAEAIKGDNILGYTDENREAQDFFADILNLVFGYNLQDADRLYGTSNTKAIDLVDEKNRLSAQVTAKNTAEKIRSTITKFIDDKLYEKFDRLIIFIIGKKTSLIKTSFETNGKFNFSKKDDVLDIHWLIKEINKITDIDLLLKIIDKVNSHLGPLIQVDKMSSEDIKHSIQILSRDIPELLKDTNETKQLKTQVSLRGEDYIEKVKNSLNNIDWETYKNLMSGSWRQNKDINNFLGDVVNSKYLNMYFSVAERINADYKDNTVGGSFETIIKTIYDNVNIRYEDALVNKKKIKILLYNMYFNCDIGLNSK